ncbi:MAG: beta-ketoacyl-[acyl-carrier-protein] synthase family protein [Planctomycetota bacterium]|nr:MAG: beta-ketoacyl-[acyl-carrier-protein] synthase family protein [Planctomycetota bacterium]REJ87899.1 MAG: beta-ketoacyl-[acyl-carrier-protein] synthase family protein [Planctomycetota bacterium]
MPDLQIYGTDDSADSAREVVITGVGMVTPIGIGRADFWNSLIEGQSGVRPLTRLDIDSLRVKFGGEVAEFDPKAYVRPRKSLKVMSREIQFGFAAADLAFRDAELSEGAIDHDRMGVVFGADMMYCELDDLSDAYNSCMPEGEFDFSLWGSQALSQMYPLWMLKYLPNMPACHIAIALDAHGPNNSITLGEVSGLLAIAEATRVIERGQADLMVAGGTSTPLHPMNLISRGDAHLSHYAGDPAGACRPFDAGRGGVVLGEGAGALVLELRSHAEARGARILARVVGHGNAFAPQRGADTDTAGAIVRSLRQALGEAGLDPSDIGHVNAHGISTVERDPIEAAAIREVLGDVPVTAPKSYFGYLGAGGGAVELVASVLALEHGRVPVTLNYDEPDPQCPVNVIHDRPLPDAKPTALALNQASTGQAASLAIVRD